MLTGRAFIPDVEVSVSFERSERMRKKIKTAFRDGPKRVFFFDPDRNSEVRKSQSSNLVVRVVLEATAIGLTNDTLVRRPFGNEEHVASVGRAPRRVCGGKRSQSKYIACERDKYINVDLRQVSWPGNSALQWLANAD